MTDALSSRNANEEPEEAINNPVLRVLRATKLTSIFLIFLTGKGAYDILTGFVNGSLGTILFVPIDPPVKIVPGTNLVLFVYMMVFGYFFTNAMSRVFVSYWHVAETWLWQPLKNRIFPASK